MPINYGSDVRVPKRIKNMGNRSPLQRASRLAKRSKRVLKRHVAGRAGPGGLRKSYRLARRSKRVLKRHVAGRTGSRRFKPVLKSLGSLKSKGSGSGGLSNRFRKLGGLSRR